MANDTTPADYVPTDWQASPSTSTPITEARLDNLEGQFALAKAWATQRLRWRGPFAATTAYLENDVISNNGIVYRCRLAHTSAGTGPDADGDPTFWEVIFTPLDPATLGPDSVPMTSITGLDDALAVRIPTVILATEATPVPVGTPDPSLVIVLEP